MNPEIKKQCESRLPLSIEDISVPNTRLTLLGQLRKRSPVLAFLLLFLWQTGENLWDSYKDIPERLDGQAGLIDKMSVSMNKLSTKITLLETNLDSIQAQVDRQRLVTMKENEATAGVLVEFADHLFELNEVRDLYREMQLTLEELHDRRKTNRR